MKIKSKISICKLFSCDKKRNGQIHLTIDNEQGGNIITIFIRKENLLTALMDEPNQNCYIEKINIKNVLEEIT